MPGLRCRGPDMTACSGPGTVTSPPVGIPPTLVPKERVFMRTLKSTILPVFIATLAAYGAVACGGDDGSGVEGGPGDPNTPEQPDLGLDPNAPGGGLTGAHNGGTRELTPQEVENINNAACAGWAGEGENLPAVLELVVDVSGSMEDDAPGGG